MILIEQTLLGFLANSFFLTFSGYIHLSASSKHTKYVKHLFTVHTKFLVVVGIQIAILIQ